jgi:hypothetical protein
MGRWLGEVVYVVAEIGVEVKPDSRDEGLS